MRTTWWTHAAMLLLGVTVTALFYEGRALVVNTASALTAATSTSTAAHHGRSRRSATPDEGVGSVPGEVSAEVSKRARRTPGGERDVTEQERLERLNALRMKQRQRLLSGEVALKGLPPGAAVSRLKGSGAAAVAAEGEPADTGKNPEDPGTPEDPVGAGDR